jgi:hypothetical protein
MAEIIHASVVIFPCPEIHDDASGEAIARRPATEMLFN